MLNKQTTTKNQPRKINLNVCHSNDAKTAGGAPRGGCRRAGVKFFNCGGIFFLVTSLRARNLIYIVIFLYRFFIFFDGCSIIVGYLLALNCFFDVFQWLVG